MVQDSEAREAGGEYGGGSTKKRLTAHEVYELLVGEIGLDRRTVLFDVDMSEVHLIIRGYRKRARDGWARQRWLIWAVSAMLGGSKFDTPAEMCPFEWEKEDEDNVKPEAEDKEALARLLEEAREWNRTHSGS